MSSRGLSSNSGGAGSGNNFRALRDYGATSSNSNNNINGITAGISTAGRSNNINYNGGGNSSAMPDVDFAGFSPTEFVSLSESIAQNINSVKSNWHTLEKAMKKIGTPSDNSEGRDKIQKIQEATNLKIISTSKDLQRLTHIVRRGDKSQKLHVDKLTSEFQIIIQKYSTSQQQIASMLKANIAINASINRQAIEDDEQQQLDDDSGQSELQQQRILRDKLEFEQGMLIEREQRFQQIEAVVLNVNDIMRDLNSLIHQQSESIDTIESQIDHAATDVENGTAQLLKARESQTRYRKKVLILLVIAVIIGLIVTGIIVSQLKS